jgi:two-component system sensor histidine kinase RegB
MGLGLFIAKTLLERSGAQLEFSNGTRKDLLRGAIVTSTWPRHKLEAKDEPAGENQQIKIG